jgi:putative methyltransferase (TIGR04325 family)
VPILPMTTVKSIVKSLTPPILWQTARKLKPQPPAEIPLFEGPYPSWDAAASLADGWDAQVIIDRTLDAALKVQKGASAFEMDGVARDRIIYSPAILAFLLLVCSKQKHSLNIIDFGGGLGSNYFQNIKLLRHLSTTSIFWGVVEQKAFAKLGLEQFQTEQLKFFSSIDDALSSPPKCDAVIFTGSLQNIAQPYALLDKVINANIDIIAMDRMLVSSAASDAVFVQHPDPKIYYSATYPVWCFSKDRFVAHLNTKGYNLVEDFPAHPDDPFDHCGFIFTRKLR